MSSNGQGANLWDMLTGATDARGAQLHCWVDDRYVSVSQAEVVADAEAMTAGMRKAGVGPGTRVAAVLTNRPDVVRGLLGVWLAGGALASLPVPSRGMALEEYVRQLSGICAGLEPVVFIAEQPILDLLPEEFHTQVACRSWASFAGTGVVASDPPGDDEPAFIQYSSGSVGSPKGCVISPRAIVAQFDMINHVIDAVPGDVFVSWLPLSHDMGMFGGLLANLARGTDLYLSTPERFAFSPSSWFGDMSRFGATSTVGSSTAVHLAARAASRRAPDWSGEGLARTKVVVVGAERVESQTLRLAADAFAPFGFREQALTPAYGLAEGTLAVTSTPVPEVARQLAVDSAALVEGELTEVDPDDPGAAVVVSSGPPCPGVTLPGLPEDTFGEITIGSTSLAMGYWRDEERTAEHFVDGTLRTGDWGFVRDGYLYPVGRMDDMISVAGRKVYAREIESAVENLDGVRRGCSTLIGHGDAGGGVRLTLFVETQNGTADFQELAEQAATISMAKGAVALDECVFLARNSLPKTPSGKIQRHRCRQMLHAGRFEPLAAVRLDQG